MALTIFMFRNFVVLILFGSLIFSPLSLHATTTSKVTPTVASITPITGIENETIIFSARVSDNDVLDSCDLYIDSEREKSMTVKRDVVYVTYSFDKTGTYKLYAKCTDTDDNVVSGAVKTITISPGSSYVEPGSLIKLGCEGDVYPNDPCTSVYFYGVDGKRHAFPTEAVFDSWFDDFDDLVVISDTVMSSIPLGKNVTFRPGKRMVKFSTNSVYAVSYAGLLRPIANAEIAETLFGEDWVSLIEIVDDVFYGNYRIGATVESSSSFSWSDARKATTSISATL